MAFPIRPVKSKNAHSKSVMPNQKLCKHHYQKHAHNAIYMLRPQRRKKHNQKNKQEIQNITLRQIHIYIYIYIYTYIHIYRFIYIYLCRINNRHQTKYSLTQQLQNTQTKQPRNIKHTQQNHNQHLQHSHKTD